MKTHTIQYVSAAVLGATFGLTPVNAQDSANKVPQKKEDVAQPGKTKLPKPVKIAMVKVAGDLIDPINVASANDGTGRMFICERHGVVRVLKDGKILKRPFLDISDTTVSSFLEQGLYDIEFHPKFKENGKFYVHYSDMWFNGDSFIVEYQVGIPPIKWTRDA
jgi:glucose/arabinose dehydrogenase